jgi:hypothetical protein
MFDDILSAVLTLTFIAVALFAAAAVWYEVSLRRERRYK